MRRSRSRAAGSRGTRNASEAVGPEWYWRRLRCMSAREIVHRGGDRARHVAWRRLQVRPGEAPPSLRALPGRAFPSRLPPNAGAAVPQEARDALLEDAERLIEGHWELLGVPRDDMADPDWFLDAATGRRAPTSRYAFSIDHRAAEEIGDAKQVWELSRHHHLTVLAAAWYLTRDDRYASAVSRSLRSWWLENPFLSGIHWTSGIELGIRLISWTWIRRLLADWPGIGDLFEDNDLAVHQIRWHQRYLAAFPSIGSSSNNHAIAEAASQLVASCAFPWFPESGRWRSTAHARLERELERNTFPSGLNREQASDYHCFVTELGLVAATEAAAAGHPLGDATWRLLCRSVDAAAAVVDERLRGPRQGDGDDGRALLVDRPEWNHWPSLLSLGGAVFGPASWWPIEPPADIRSTLVGALGTAEVPVAERPSERASRFADAGLTILRSPSSNDPEIWCRCDAGPHGFLAIAAHAHADALSIEVRHGGVDVLADPGTYCYYSDPEWRAYFRSTIGHNTLELAGADQSESGGPFLWTRHASATERHGDPGAAGGVWSAEHDGYLRLQPPAVHRRTVRLDPTRRHLEIVDHVLTDGHVGRLAFHLGPTVQARLDGSCARLEWPSARGPAAATLSLPENLKWTSHRARLDPILGWYSPAFGVRQPCVTLVGEGVVGFGRPDLVTVLEFNC